MFYKNTQKLRFDKENRFDGGWKMIENISTIILK